MNPSPLRMTDAVFASLLLSRTVRDLISRAYVHSHGDVPMVTVASFLATALRIGSDSTATAALRQLIDPVSKQIPGSLPVDPKQAPRTDSTVSDALWQALQAAQKTRLETHGDDQFVGLRYVLFEMFSATTEPLKSEVLAVCAATGVKQDAAALAVARYCMKAHEPPEFYSAWERILGARGLEPALDSWSGPRTGSAGAQDGPPYPRPKALRGTEIALLHSDDPWSAMATDQSGAREEAEAFADMIVAKDFDPPLAVGIFGNWGSGKSYFMRLLYEAVADNRARLLRDTTAGGITFCQHVVQIRFNAWHYAEANLWASLVDHVFTSLNQWNVATGPAGAADQLFGKLTTARRLTLEAASTLVESRKQKKLATDRLSAAEVALRKKRAAVQVDPQTFAASAFEEVLGSAAAQSELDKAAESLGLTGLTKGYKELQVALSALNSETENLSLIKTGVARQMSSTWMVLGIAAGTLVLPVVLNWVAGQLGQPALQITGAVAGIIAPITAALGLATQKANAAVEVVRKYRDRFTAQVGKEVAENKASVEAREKELADAETVVAARKQALEQAVQSENQAAIDYNSETGRDRVLRFVSNRVAEGGYARHLSFVATIRKDFEELSRLLALARTEAPATDEAYKAHLKLIDQLVGQSDGFLEIEEEEKLRQTAKPPEAEEKVYERIVLYIDDLDRCQPEQVVAVLQAIHLLLAFPLFVVFVAVDVRWLRHALKNRYPNLSVTPETADPVVHAAGAEVGATTYDYLEKIFQIPYWVRRFDADVTRSILQARMGPLAPAQGAAPLVPESHAPLGPDVDEKPVKPSGNDGVGAELPPPRLLSLTGGERDCIDAVAAMLDGLPRRTLRFINSYWIIKAGLSPAEQDNLESTGYRAVLGLLAIAITLDEEFPVLITALQSAPGSSDLVQVVGAMAFRRSASPTRIVDCFKAAGDPDLADIKKFGPLVSRFSFHCEEAW